MAGVPLWVRTIALQSVLKLPLVSFPFTANNFDTPMPMFEQFLTGLRWRRVQYLSGNITGTIRWRGEMFLVRGNENIEEISQ
jgi:hypothetical protein